ncbi:hypothetical protein J8L85_12620 [Maribacter sp. MMG018]|uniref:hypothetical protein n=1 Tax=Maribacter sp. MMG018 TaxID=2822688 RepID=UPI001B368B4E|nr:hypothetical protein [Maribacter sp. MMG018]MBQ4915288.1 hypothetical protein [Maribacter sp. MMG018]
MWKLLYDSLEAFKVVDFRDIAHENAKDLIKECGGGDIGFKEILIQLFGLEDEHKERNIKRIHVIYENDTLAGILYGDHVLNLKIRPFYKGLILKSGTVECADEISVSTVHKVVARIIKEKNSIISPKEFKIFKRFANTEIAEPFMNNMYCLDSTTFSDLRLDHVCTTRQFKQIKNEYSKKWNAIVAMKDFRVTKLYYKKHLLIGFSLNRKVDGEQFFWSGQLQEVLESLK